MPEKSIIIITKDRWPLLPKAVASVLDSLPPSLAAEILVVDETDRPLLHDWPDSVRYFTIPVRHRGFGYARHVGLSLARGDLIACVDDDVVVAPNWAEEIFRPFEDPLVAAVGGAVLPQVEGITAAGRAVSLMGFPAGGLERSLKAGGIPQPSALISTCNCAFRADIGCQVGGFDHQLHWGGEDQEFFARIAARHKTLFVPNAVVFHRQRESLRSAIHWFYRRGNADFFLKQKQGSALGALVWPVRSNFGIKLAAAAALSIAAAMQGLLAFCILLAMIGCVLSITQFLRHRRWRTLIGRHSGNIDAATLFHHLTAGGLAWRLPLIKGCLDLGFEVGRYTGFCRYVFGRLSSAMTEPLRETAAPAQAARTAPANSDRRPQKRDGAVEP